MIQSLDVISVNLWDILISLANLLILFLIIKKFLFRPVKNILAKRESEINSRYSHADKAQHEADESKAKWEKQLAGAKSEADAIMADAVEKAGARSEQLIYDAKERANRIVSQAEADAASEYRKAKGKIKQEIIGVSEALTEKILDREIDVKDHHRLIESFMEEIGDGDE